MASDIKDNVSEELTIIERKVLPVLSEFKEVSEIVKKTGLKEIEVQRALQWLSNKSLVKIHKKEEEIINLTDRGKQQRDKKLPELRILENVEKNGEITRSELLKKGIISPDEFGGSIGKIKAMNGAFIENIINDIHFKKTAATKIVIDDIMNKTQAVLNTLNYPILTKILMSSKLAESVLELEKRGSIKKDKKTLWSATLTPEGEKLSKLKMDNKLSEKITSKMLKDKTWKNTTFRSFDIKSKVPRVNRGKKHFVNEAVDYIKSIWLEMGFEEMTGNDVQSAFWDMDTLFVPQDHPAREEQDTFYLHHKSKIPQKLFEKVKKVHENGGDTGSTGWQTKFSKEITSETLLRTHTTVLSARTISKLKKDDLPKKFFSIGKVYRNEALDWKHLFEFQQVEGIVVDPDCNLAQLKSYLREFFLKMGYSDVKIRPAHFPYTEPSAEVEVFNPVKREWVEMGGCGIFRPEVTKTLLGFECPVLAWGLGMERIISYYFGINDLRDLYKNDLEQIKRMKSWTK